MRQGQSSKRSRGRSGGRRNASPRHQSFDSNGPSIRIRGNAHQVYEKYIQLARDANAAGDRITAENMYQHAEHYYRIMNVDDGNAQNRGNGPDQRQHSRHGQHSRDGEFEGDGEDEQAAGGNGSDGPNGSDAQKSANRGNGARENDSDSDGDRRERQPRRPRRNPARTRAEASDAPDAVSAQAAPAESSIVVEPEAAADMDVKDVN